LLVFYANSLLHHGGTENMEKNKKASQTIRDAEFCPTRMR